ncbi:MAG: hypothetical protein AB1Z23_06545 [Eubacteriales bacterium]
MKRYIKIAISVLIISIVLSGCIGNDIKSIDDEVIETFEVIKSEGDSSQGSIFEKSQSGSSDENRETNNGLDEKFSTISFSLVSGVYSRNVVQDDIEVLEMFAQDRNNFVRIASNNLDKEVFAYNYVSDEFTYLYYFDGELFSKIVIDVESGKVIQDDENYAEMLMTDAEELKEYFNALINSAGISVEELKG